MSKELVKVDVSVPGGEIDKAAAEVLTRVLGAPADEAGGAFGDMVGMVRDRISAWRHINRLRIAKQTVQKIKDEGLEPGDLNALPLREVPAVLEAISDVDQDELSELWAGLLADAMSPKNHRSADKHLVAVLKSMTEEDALLFSAFVMSDELRKVMWRRGKRASRKIFQHKDDGEEELKRLADEMTKESGELIQAPLDYLHGKLAPLMPGERYRISVENLIELGLVEYGDSNSRKSASTQIPSIPMRHNGDLGPLVSSIMKAIELPEKNIARWRKFPVEAPRGFIPAFALLLTPKGKRLVESCQIKLPSELVTPILASLGDEQE
ncbi:Abi-alpha family protein [Paracoccus sp. SSK6]|uniref:Abi-alpha family protein n=1 Tax=Paracoccus sp. SSK6 TaxID=3143131 RepID=UPI00321995D7